VTNGEAHDINIVCRALLGWAAQDLKTRALPTDADLGGALERLADRANKHLMAGFSGAKVREMWPSRPQPAAAAPSSDLVQRLQNQLALVIAQALDARTHVQENETLHALEILDELVDARRCRSCGCTETSACESEEEGPCGWAEADLCTACVSP
jgi:hypothetical protein